MDNDLYDKMIQEYIRSRGKWSFTDTPKGAGGNWGGGSGAVPMESSIEHRMSRMNQSIAQSSQGFRQRLKDFNAPSNLDIETLLQLYKTQKIPLHDLIKLLGQQQSQSAAT